MSKCLSDCVCVCEVCVCVCVCVCVYVCVHACVYVYAYVRVCVSSAHLLPRPHSAYPGAALLYVSLPVQCCWIFPPGSHVHREVLTYPSVRVQTSYRSFRLAHKHVSVLSSSLMPFNSHILRNRAGQHLGDQDIIFFLLPSF